MKTKITGILLGTLLALTTAQQAGAVYMREITNGIICKPMLPTQSNLVEYKSWGLLNKTTTTDVWVGCPFHQVQTLTTNPVLLAAIDMANNNDFEVVGSCLFREVDTDGTVVNTVSNPFTLPANDSGSAVFLGGLSDADHSFTFACKLMRNTYIARIFHYTAQTAP